MSRAKAPLSAYIIHRKSFNHPCSAVANKPYSLKI